MKLDRYSMAAIKRTAQIIKPKRAKLSKLFAKRKEIDEQFNEVNNRLDEFIIDGEVIETDNSLLLNFN